MYPWKTDNWIVSQYNFDEEALKSVNKADNVELHDLTIRAIEETAGVVISKEDKVNLAIALDNLGLPRIEVYLSFMPDVKEVNKSVKAITSLGLKAKVFALTAASRSEVDRAIDVNLDGLILNTLCFTPLTHKYVYPGIPREKWYEETMDVVEYAKDHGLYVTFFPSDSTRCEWEVLSQIYKGAEERHADEVGLVDTLGVASPHAVTHLVRKIKEIVNLPVMFHAHNSFGLALANAIAGFSAGAEFLGVNVNGFAGECGNPPLAELAIALKVNYGVDLGIKYEKLYEISKLVEKISKVPIPFNKPIVGEEAFAAEMFVIPPEHATPTWVPFSPGFVGNKIRIKLGKYNDPAAINWKIRELGIDVSLSPDQMNKLLNKIRERTKKKKQAVTDEELEGMIKKMIL